MRKQLGYLPGQEPHYSRRKKLEIWFYYYKWWLAAAIFVLILLIPVFRNLLGIGIVNPDYQIACVTAGGISDSTVQALTEALEAMGQDLNGDGIVKVSLVQYRTGAGDQETKLYFGYASTITIQADITECDSHFFLLDNPERFQIGYQVLADEQGSLPEDNDYSADGRYLPFPALKLSLPEEAARELSGLYIGQRGYYEESRVPELPAYRALWKLLTQ